MPGDAPGLAAALARNQGRAAAVGFLERHGRHAEALLQVGEGCCAFPDDARLEQALLRCLQHAGRTDEALSLRRRLFHSRLSLEAFQALLEAATRAGHDVAALREEVLAWVQLQEASGGRLDGDVTLRAQKLCAEQRWSEAAQLVQSGASCSVPTLRSIALNLGAGERDTAAALLMRVLDAAMRGAASPCRLELQLVAVIGQRMHAPQRAVWLAHLRKAYAGKRNFLNGLPLR